MSQGFKRSSKPPSRPRQENISECTTLQTKIYLDGEEGSTECKVYSTTQLHQSVIVDCTNQHASILQFLAPRICLTSQWLFHLQIQLNSQRDCEAVTYKKLQNPSSKADKCMENFARTKFSSRNKIHCHGELFLHGFLFCRASLGSHI